jgi:hypothetical protein
MLGTSLPLDISEQDECISVSILFVCRVVSSSKETEFVPEISILWAVLHGRGLLLFLEVLDCRRWD